MKVKIAFIGLRNALSITLVCIVIALISYAKIGEMNIVYEWIICWIVLISVNTSND